MDPIVQAEEAINYFDLDHGLVYAFLLITLALGLYAGRGIKKFKDYALAKKIYGTPVLVLTLLATAEGGASTIGVAQNVFQDGIIIVVALLLGDIIGCSLTALFIAPKIKYFEGCISIGEVMERGYGTYGKIMMGIAGSIYSIFLVTSQTLAMGYICEKLLGIDSKTAILTSAFIFIAYSFRGGIRSVTITDVLQFAVLIIMIPIIATDATSYAGGVVELFQKIPQEKLILFGHKKFTYYLVVFLVWAGVIPTFQLSPPMVQRMLMAEDSKQLKKMFFTGAIVTPILTILVMFIGLSAFALYPDIPSKEALPHIINKVLPVGVKGLAIAGILAVIMSTADSFLNASAISFTHDVVKPLYDRRKVAINELKLVKYMTLLN